MVGLCDYCGKSLIHYNHEGCYDGYPEELLDRPEAGEVDMETCHECEECKQPVVMELAPWPAFFGQIISAEDWAEFMHAGLCSLCTYYLADFAAMRDTKGMYL